MGRAYKKKRAEANREKKRKSDRGANGQSQKEYESHSRRDFVTQTVEHGNFKMEVYYTLQGLYSQKWDSSTLIDCSSSGDEMQREHARWKAILAHPLPASFRIGKDVPAYYQVQLQKEFEALLKEASEFVPPETDQSEDVPDNYRGPLDDVKATPLHFLNSTTTSTCSSRSSSSTTTCLGHQLNLGKTSIRKNPAMKKIHDWLKQQCASGHVTRQETVSMIPPVLLNVQGTDAVLDMCAAPGSKTSQLLEDLSVGSNLGGSSTTAGVLVANDASSQRAFLLVTQLKRVLGHCPVALVTCVNAQHFPAVVQFDKILCDVPCTGDGTARKNIGIYKHWTNVAAVSLHSLQTQIAEKGASQLLKVGGCMVYSTCSHNPIENEAVVAELLRQGNGSLELVDVSSLLPGFKTRPGLSSWKVLCEDQTQRQMNNARKRESAKLQKECKESEKEAAAAVGAVPSENGDVVAPIDESASQDRNNAEKGALETLVEGEKPESESILDVLKIEKRKFDPTCMGNEAKLLELAKEAGLCHFESFADVPELLQKRIKASCFPPTTEEAGTMHLERCIRCLPHDNDTGGFFVALLRKTAPWSATDRRAEAAASASTAEVDDSTPDAKRAKLENDAVADDGDGGGIADKDDVSVDGLVGADNKPIVKKDAKGEEIGKDNFAQVKDELMLPLIEYYGLSNGFEKELYMARAGSESKVIYYVARPVKHLFDVGIQKRVTIINTGLKGFMRNNRNAKETETSYRVCQEGIHFLIPYMTKRKLIVSSADFKACLNGDGKTIHVSKFSETFSEQVKALSTGSFAIVLEGYEDQLDQKLVAAMWKCRGDSVDTLVAKVEVEGLRSKLDTIEGKAE